MNGWDWPLHDPATDLANGPEGREETQARIALAAGSMGTREEEVEVEGREGEEGEGARERAHTRLTAVMVTVTHPLPGTVSRRRHPLTVMPPVTPRDMPLATPLLRLQLHIPALTLLCPLFLRLPVHTAHTAHLCLLPTAQGGTREEVQGTRTQQAVRTVPMLLPPLLLLQRTGEATGGVAGDMVLLVGGMEVMAEVGGMAVHRLLRLLRGAMMGGGEEGAQVVPQDTTRMGEGRGYHTLSTTLGSAVHIVLCNAFSTPFCVAVATGHLRCTQREVAYTLSEHH